jgi:hypothetical protein
MRKLAERFLVGVICLVLLAGALSIVAGANAYAKGKPQPPPSPCAPTITLPDGTVCTLVAWGSDCVYECPF